MNLRPRGYFLPRVGKRAWPIILWLLDGKPEKGGEGMIEKQKALEMALAQIEKQFGKGAVMRLGQNEAMHVDAIPTGSLSLDLALGIGGLPEAESWRFMARNPRVKLPWRFTVSRKDKKAEATRPLSM